MDISSVGTSFGGGMLADALLKAVMRAVPCAALLRASTTPARTARSFLLQAWNDTAQDASDGRLRARPRSGGTNRLARHPLRRLEPKDLGFRIVASRPMYQDAMRRLR